jgi:hypothetical protein
MTTQAVSRPARGGSLTTALGEPEIRDFGAALRRVLARQDR